MTKLQSVGVALFSILALTPAEMNPRSILPPIQEACLEAREETQQNRVEQKSRKEHKVKVTSYTMYVVGDGKKKKVHDKMACGTRIRKCHYGVAVALSRDLAKQYQFGDEFELIAKDKKMRVIYLDRMPGEVKNRVDLLLSSSAKCREWGNTAGTLVPVHK